MSGIMQLRPVFTAMIPLAFFIALVAIIALGRTPVKSNFLGIDIWLPVADWFLIGAASLTGTFVYLFRRG